MRIKFILNLKILSLFVSILSGCLSIILILAMGDGYISLIAILPLIFTILALICIYFFFDKIKSNIGFILIAIQLFIRNVILPIFISSEGFTFANTSFSIKHLIYVIFLMLSEMVICAFAIVCAKKPKIITETNQDIYYMKRLYSRKSLANLMLLVFIGVCVLLWFSSDLVRKSYANILYLINNSLKEVYVNYTVLADVGSSERAIASLFAFLFSIVRVILPAYLIILSGQRHTYKNFILACLCVASQLLFISSSTAEPLIIAGILGVLLMDVFPEKRKFIIHAAIVCGLLLAMGLVISGSLVSSNEISVSFWLNAYFTGPTNVAATFKIGKDANLGMIWWTLLRSIPSFFMPFNLGDGINEVFTKTYPGHIFSTIGSGYYLFGPCFAAIPSYILASVSIKYGYYFNNTVDKWKRVLYLYISIMTAFGLGIYNVPIVLYHLFRIALPLWLFVLMSKFAFNKN